eukprot:Skav205136  [mRNA]  locus=scaffold3411:150282:156646:+ [translate_table: standard]
MATSPQPPSAAMMRGPKSRAGFQPACVMGAYRGSRTATVMPMVNGTPTRSILPKTLLPLLVMPKITKAKMKVPQASVNNAPATDTSSKL